MEKKTYFEAWILIVVFSGLFFLAGIKAARYRDTMSDVGDMDIVETAMATGKFNTLISAVEAAGLVDALKSSGPMTVFAPTDEAFGKLPVDVLDDLLNPDNRAKLRALLKHHIIPGRVALRSRRLKTLNDDFIMVNTAGRWLVNDAIIVKKNIIASNGMIHAINEVLLTDADAGRRAALKLIEAAVEIGVLLFNDGKVIACAEVYKSALEDLKLFGPDVISFKVKTSINDALAESEIMDDPSEIAWTFRHLLDDISESLANQTMTIHD